MTTLSLIEKKLNKYTFKYSIPKFFADGGLKEVWLDYTDNNNITKSIQGPGWPGNYPLTGTIVATLPSHSTFSVRLAFRSLRNGNLQYSNIINLTTHSGKIDPPLNVTAEAINASGSSLDPWIIDLKWDNSRNIGSAPVSALKIVYNYGEKELINIPQRTTSTGTTIPASSFWSTIQYQKTVNISEWNSSNSYQWTLESPVGKSSNACYFTLQFINQNGEESVAADVPRQGNSVIPSNTFMIYSRVPYTHLDRSVLPLFNTKSWDTNNLVDNFIKPYLTTASNRWSKYLGIDETIASKVRLIDPKFYGGIYLNRYTTINNSTKPIIECTPARYVAIKLNDGRYNFITVSFNLTFNKYYENNISRASNFDLIWSTTHHLGHALGIGVYWHLNQLYNSSLADEFSVVSHPRYRLDGRFFPQTQLVYNVLYRAPRRQSIYRDGLLTSGTIERPNPLGATCEDYSLTYDLECGDYSPENQFLPPLSRRIFRDVRRFIPLDQIGSLVTDNIPWGAITDTRIPINSPLLQPVEFRNGDRRMPFVSGRLPDTQTENFAGSHFGIIDNPINGKLFTYNHRYPALNDIMFYKVITSGQIGTHPQKISGFSISHLKDLGYIEIYENQRQGPADIRCETIDQFAAGYTTSKLTNHTCCRGFSPSQIESWNSNGINLLLNDTNEEMHKIADIVDGKIYSYINTQGCKYDS